MALLSTRVDRQDRNRDRTPSPRHTSTPRNRETSTSRPPIAPPPPPLEPPLTSAEAHERLTKVWAGLQQDLLEPKCNTNDLDRHEIKHIAEVIEILSPESDIRMLKIMTKRIRVLALAIHWN
ncbi:unnamed protein product [Gordionus sp. m RMFG-2023]